MVRISGLELQYIPFIGRWNNPLILSIDPNFLGHSSIPSEGGCYSHPIWLQGHSCLQLINKPTNPKSNPQLRGQQIKPQSCATIPTSPTTPKHTQPTPNPTIPHQTCHFSRRTPKGCGRTSLKTRRPFQEDVSFWWEAPRWSHGTLKRGLTWKTRHELNHLLDSIKDLAPVFLVGEKSKTSRDATRGWRWWFIFHSYGCMESLLISRCVELVGRGKLWWPGGRYQEWLWNLIPTPSRSVSSSGKYRRFICHT